MNALVLQGDAMACIREKGSDRYMLFEFAVWVHNSSPTVLTVVTTNSHCCSRRDEKSEEKKLLTESVEL